MSCWSARCAPIWCTDEHGNGAPTVPTVPRVAHLTLRCGAYTVCVRKKINPGNCPRAPLARRPYATWHSGVDSRHKHASNAASRLHAAPHSRFAAFNPKLADIDDFGGPAHERVRPEGVAMPNDPNGGYYSLKLCSTCLRRIADDRQPRWRRFVIGRALRIASIWNSG